MTKKVSELPAASSAESADEVLLQQGGVLKRVPASQLPFGGLSDLAAVVADSGGVLAGATPLQHGINVCTQEGTIDGSVVLPAATGSGKVVQVHVDSPFRILVYPESGGQINQFGVDIAYAVFPRQRIQFIDVGTKLWDFTTNLPFLYPIYFFTAHAGGGQADAEELGMGNNVINVAASAGDSVRLPNALGGCNLIAVYNQTANRINIFPDDDQKINGYANNLPVSLPPGKMAIFNDIGPGPDQWIGGVVGASQETILCPSNNVALATVTDSTTYYFGKWAPIASEGANRIYFRNAGRIKAVHLQTIVLGTLGTAEAATASVRVNSSVDTTISAAVKYDAVIGTEISNTALDVVIAPGDFIELKVAMPAFATNPTSVYHSFEIVFEGQ